MITALVIPAYQPSEELLSLLSKFQGMDSFLPIVVDDGSGSDYLPVFDALPGEVILLRHAENRGKGRALKTAFQYILQNCPQCGQTATADADGQHRFEDILRICACAEANPKTLVLGSRRLDQGVPFRSRLGNGLTRRLFSVASGVKVYDTQTGLRAFGREYLQRFIDVPGERYEYETNALLSAAQSGIPIREEWIETVYLDANASSHFRTLRDSFRIFVSILKFSASSLLCFLVDYSLALLLKTLTAPWPTALSLNFSVIAARLVSTFINFNINRKLVFKGNETLGKAIVKYALLAIGILLVNLLLMHVLTGLHWPFPLAKIVVELVLFCFSFVIQGRFVFRRK